MIFFEAKYFYIVGNNYLCKVSKRLNIVLAKYNTQLIKTYTRWQKRKRGYMRILYL